MKKLLILLSVVMMLSFVGCSDEESEKKDSGFDPLNPDPKEHLDYARDAAKEMENRLNEVSEKRETEEAERKENFWKNVTEISDVAVEAPDWCKLEVKSYGIEYSDFYGCDIITIKADFTNLTDSNMSFLSSQNGMTAYQDGVVLSRVFGEYDYETGTAIKTGKTIEVAFSYMLRNTDSVVELEYYNGGDTYSCSVELK